MATISRNHLSGATNGHTLLLAIDSGAYTTVHTPTTTTADFEEIWIWLANVTTSTQIVTFQIGHDTNVNNRIVVQVPAESVILALPGITLQGASTYTVKAASSAANSITAWGHINLIDAA